LAVQAEREREREKERERERKREREKERRATQEIHDKKRSESLYVEEVREEGGERRKE
jgi:hypothetical protein